VRVGNRHSMGHALAASVTFSLQCPHARSKTSPKLACTRAILFGDPPISSRRPLTRIYSRNEYGPQERRQISRRSRLHRSITSFTTTSLLATKFPAFSTIRPIRSTHSMKTHKRESVGLPIDVELCRWLAHEMAIPLPLNQLEDHIFARVTL
jgi:hypothetical protein